MTNTAPQSASTVRIEYSVLSSTFPNNSVQDLVTLLSAQRSRLKGFIRKHLHREDLIDDVLQQTWLEAYRNWDQFRGESKPETWLFGIAFNLLRNSRSKQCRLDYVFQETVDGYESVASDFSEQPQNQLMRKQSISQLKHSIDQLPKGMRSVVELVLIDGYAYQDAADHLNLPIGTVRSRLSRARDTLRELMEVAA